MTREELLKKIDFEKSWLYDCGIFGSDVDIAFHAIKKSVIEALEQEPRKDEVILTNKEYRELISNEYDHGYEKGYLEALEQDPNKWIPVSERLPKIASVYIVTRYYPNNVMNPNYLVDACFFDGSNTWYNDNRINHERAYADNVIAWQENPEPYKAESEG